MQLVNTPRQAKQVTVRRISPLEAVMLLDMLPPNQRGISEKHVTAYAADMAAGQWQISNDAITITNSGQLINGQHRMTAVVKCGQTQEFLVMTIPDDEAPMMFKQMDQGKPRTNADVLKTRGYTRVMPRSALAVAGWRHDQTGKPETMTNAYYRPTPSQLEEWIDTNAPLEPTIDIYQSLSSLSCPAYMVALHHIWCRNGHTIAAPDFWRQVATGDTPFQSGPWWLREKLMRHKSATRRLESIGRQAEAIQAWNVYISGRKAKRLQWNPHRPFPVSR